MPIDQAKRRRVVAVPDPRRCACGHLMTDAELRRYRIAVDGVDQDTGEPRYKGFPEVCEDCADVAAADARLLRYAQ